MEMSLTRKKVMACVWGGLLIGPLAWAGTIEGHVRNVAASDLANCVISVEDIEGSFPAPQQPALMDQKYLTFVPHVLVVLAGTTVEFPNSDPLSHNVFSISEAKRFNLGLYQRGVLRRMKFDKPGVVELLCNVHLEMSAYIVVVKNPYFARTDSDGKFRIDGVPPGKHRLRCWHERLEAHEQNVEVPKVGTVSVTFTMGVKARQHSGVHINVNLSGGKHDIAASQWNFGAGFHRNGRHFPYILNAGFGGPFVFSQVPNKLHDLPRAASQAQRIWRRFQE
jgi:plastocyanin